MFTKEQIANFYLNRLVATVAKLGILSYLHKDETEEYEKLVIEAENARARIKELINYD